MRDEIQKEAVESWLPHKSGTILLPTGFGKTRVGVLAKRAVNPEKTLIVTSRIPLVKQ
jgi:superfamily II DNA or RNA helicase